MDTLVSVVLTVSDERFSLSSPHVSCVIPTHGRPEFLREALQSALEQTVLPKEIVVVSDDENEESRQVVESFNDASVPVRYVRNETEPGASGSRNLGARSTSTEWLAFLDDDDRWAPEYLEHALERANATQAACIVTWLEIFRGDETAPGLRMSPQATARTAGSRNPGLTGSNFLMRRESFDALGGFDPGLRVLNDLDLVYRYLMGAGTFAVNARAEVFQRRHNSGQLTRPSTMRAMGVETYLHKHRATLRLSDIRHLRLMAHRIRFRAAKNPVQKVWHLILGALNASPVNIRTSIDTWSQRRVWHER